MDYFTIEMICQAEKRELKINYFTLDIRGFIKYTPHMKLTEYLKLINKRPVNWAKEMGLSEATVWRAVSGKAFPSPSTIRAIETASNGAVKPEDWY